MCFGGWGIPGMPRQAALDPVRCNHYNVIALTFPRLETSSDEECLSTQGRRALRRRRRFPPWSREVRLVRRLEQPVGAVDQGTARVRLLCRALRRRRARVRRHHEGGRRGASPRTCRTSSCLLAASRARTTRWPSRCLRLRGSRARRAFSGGPSTTCSPLKRPPFVLLENVDRLLKSPATQRGRDFAIILSCLAQLGYVAEWRVVNAADYGFPQRRRRVFLYAHRLDHCGYRWKPVAAHVRRRRDGAGAASLEGRHQVEARSEARTPEPTVDLDVESRMS